MLGPVDESVLADPAAAGGHAPYGPSVTRLAQLLRDAGHDVVAVTHRRGFPELRRAEDRLELHRVSSRGSAAAHARDQFAREIRAMRDVVIASRPDVVHAHWTYEWALAALGTPFPVVITVHDAPHRVLRRQHSAYSAMRYVMAMRVRARSGRAVMSAVSPYVAQTWRAAMRDRRPFGIVPNAVDVGQQPDAKSAVPTIVEVATSDRLKNVGQLVRAFELVSAVVPECRLVLIGAGLGPDSPLRRLATERGVDDRIDWLGVRDYAEVRRQLRRAWVHCHASLEESFGMSIAEAMAEGTPVVAGAGSGGPAWLLEGGEVGWLVDTTDASDVASALVRALEDHEARARFAAGGRARISELCADGAIVESVETLYATAVSRP